MCELNSFPAQGAEATSKQAVAVIRVSKGTLKSGKDSSTPQALVASEVAASASRRSSADGF